MGWHDLTVEQTYFEEAEPFVFDSPDTYTDAEAPIASTRTYDWNHSIGEIVTALLTHGLRLDRLEEHDWTVYPRYPWLKKTDDGRWVPPPDAVRVPLSFTLTATKVA